MTRSPKTWDLGPGFINFKINTVLLGFEFGISFSFSIVFLLVWSNFFADKEQRTRNIQLTFKSFLHILDGWSRFPQPSLGVIQHESGTGFPVLFCLYQSDRSQLL